ncbi:MAG: shikimate kinase [Thermoplasmata archaeon]
MYCLIGDPVSHSLSPAIQNYAFVKARIGALYIPVRVGNGELGRYMGIFREFGVKGMNVTMPHKTDIIPYLDKLDAMAEKIGAVNTVVNYGSTLKGFNTDATGIIEAVRQVAGKIKGRKAIILGRGGMARAASFAFEQEGGETEMLGREDMRVESISRRIRGADIICNCTPIGMNGEPSPVPLSLIEKRLLVIDAAYSAVKTELIRNAEREGCKTITGLQLLINQGAGAFKLWTGLNPDRDGMMRAARSRISEIKENGARNIYLVGFMGTGKSTVGRRVAEALGMKFEDTDSLLVKKFKRPVKRIIEELGENEFRRMESNLIKALGNRRGTVVATGGGAVLDYRNIYRMKKRGIVVLLRASPETVIERLMGDSSRPLLNGPWGNTDPRKAESLLSARRNYYDIARDIDVDTDGMSIEEVAAEITREIGDFR